MKAIWSNYLFGNEILRLRESGTWKEIKLGRPLCQTSSFETYVHPLTLSTLDYSHISAEVTQKLWGKCEEEKNKKYWQGSTPLVV